MSIIDFHVAVNENFSQGDITERSPLKMQMALDCSSYMQINEENIPCNDQLKSGNYSKQRSTASSIFDEQAISVNPTAL